MPIPTVAHLDLTYSGPRHRYISASLLVLSKPLRIKKRRSNKVDRETYPQV